MELARQPTCRRSIRSPTRAPTWKSRCRTPTCAWRKTRRSSRSADGRQDAPVQDLERLVALIGIVVRPREYHEQAVRGDHEDEVTAVAPGEEPRLVGARHEHPAFPP